MKPKTTPKGREKSVQGTRAATVKKPGMPRSPSLPAFLDKYGIWITFALAGIMILIVFHDFISGRLYYLFKDIGSDSVNQMYPHFLHVSSYLRTDGFPGWSFAQGMGQELTSSTINDPFSLLVCLLPAGSIAYAFIWLELTKLVLTSAAAYFFLRYWTRNPLILATGVLSYSFCSFMIIGGGWTIFSTEMLFFTLLLLAFEQLYHRGSWYLFPLAIALTGMLRPFDLFIFGLFLIIYFLFRHFSSDRPTLRKFVVTAGQMLGLAIIGLMISMFCFAPGLQTMLDSPRVAGTAGYFSTLLSKPVFFTETSRYYQTLALRLFSNDILGNGSLFKGWYNYMEAPMIYIGILPLLMAPQVFLHLPNRQRAAFGIFLGIFILASVFPFFRYAFWAFAGDYFRLFSLFPALILLIYSLRAFDEIREKQGVNLILLGITLAFLLTLLYFPWKDAQLIHNEHQSAARNFLIGYAAILGVSRYFPSRTVFFGVLLAVVFLELAFVNYKTVNDRDCLSQAETLQRTGYNDYSVEALELIRSGDNSFYRIHKDYTSKPTIHTSFNDAQAQGYFGTMSYSSFNQKYYTRFLEEMKLIEKGNERETRWSVGLVKAPLLLNWASTKYSLRKREGSNMGFPEKLIATFGDIKTYKTENFLPLGFTYEAYIPLSDFLQLSSLAKMILLLKAVVIEEPVDPVLSGKLTRFDLHDTTSQIMIDTYLQNVSTLKEDTLAINTFRQSRIEGTIKVDKPKLLFFTIPYDRGWHAIVDGREVSPILTNIGFMGLMMDPGSHHVVLFYKSSYFTLSLVVSVAGILIFALLTGWSLVRKRKVKPESTPS